MMVMREKSQRFGTFLWVLPFFCFLLLNFEIRAQSAGGEAQNEGEDAQNQSSTVDVEIPTDEQTVARGRELFGQHCSACHGIEKQIIGPALASVHQTRPLPWLIRFIKNSQNVIQNENDEYAQQLYEQFNRQLMPPFEFLSTDDILAIMAYIQAESVASTAGGVNEATSSVTGNSNDEERGDEEEAYSQKDEGEQEAEDVSSGIPGSLTFGVIIGMMILIGIIFVVAKRSGKSRRR